MKVKFFLVSLFLIISILGISSKTITVGKGQNYESLQDAIDNARSGDVIRIKQGVHSYTNGISMYKKENIQIIGEGFVDIVCIFYENILTLNSCKNVTIDNVHLVHSYNKEYTCSDANVIAVYNSENITIKNCELNGCGDIGVNIYESDKVTVMNNYIHSNVSSAINITSDSKKMTRITIENNRILNNAAPIVYNYNYIYKDTNDYKGIITKNNLIYPEGENSSESNYNFNEIIAQ